MAKQRPSETSTRTRMIRATAELLQAQGFHATGLSEILKLSRAPKGSLYFHFPGGKEQLALEAVREGGTRVGKAMEKTLATHRELDVAVRSLLKGSAALLERSRFREGCPVATIALETATTNEAIRKACAESFEGWRQIVHQRLIAAGLRESQAEGLATLILASLEGGLILSRTAQSAEPLEKIAEELATVVGQALEYAVGKGPRK